MMLLLTQWRRSRGLIFQPARRYGNHAVPGQNGVYFRDIGVADLPAEGAQVLGDLGGRAEADERRADDRVAQCPAQRELWQALAVFRGEPLQLLDRGEVAREV